MENSKASMTLLGREIRTLYESEIDCRIGQKFDRDQSVTILLYKNARVDMALLDELVGPENWQRDHKEVCGNNYCGVGVNAGTAWIWKWDCGVPSNTEPQKGEASDAFKRACVNWGIGRELYTAPRIRIRLDEREWNGGKPWVSFGVGRIHYNDLREIDELVIVDEKGSERFRLGGSAPRREASGAPAGGTATQGAKAPGTDGKAAKPRVMKPADVDAGRADRIVRYLSQVDVLDDAAWDAAIARVRADNPGIEIGAAAAHQLRIRAQKVSCGVLQI